MTGSHDNELPNYDIRTDKASMDKLAAFRAASNLSAIDVAAVRDNFVKGESVLRSRVPTLTVEYNADIRTPEVIAPDVKQGRSFLTPPSSDSRIETLRNFVKENNDLVGVTNEQTNELKVTADYTNPDGNLSFASLEQRIDGIPVFRGEVKAGFTKSGEMIRVINNLAPGLNYSSLSRDFSDPLNAVRSAAGNINYELKTPDITRNDSESTDLMTVFGKGDWATTAEKMYFPTEPGIAIPAWRVLIWEPSNAYYVIVDAQSGTALWRKNITEDQTQSATYQVYTNPNAMVNIAESPAPLTPGPTSPNGAQGALLTRVNVTRVGNEAPYTFNNNGWMTDGTNFTDGNNVEAGIDRDGINGVDATQPGNPNRVFDSTWNPPPGNPPPGDDPLTAQAQRGATIQMFYAMNLYHDELYRLGFTEQARNFQASNFGRGGTEADRVSAEGQDSSGTNNANFSTPADGGRGRMQMYIWTGPTPDRDGTTDIDIIYHEVTHGTSNRLHGNGSGLSTNMSRGMGEGWSDFYSHSLTSEPGDPLNGIYTTGGYATLNITAGFVNNYYYGIRRYPKAVIGFTGGANNKPHNAFTFSYINADCLSRMTAANFAFGPGPVGISSACDQVHNIGEIWSSALWEVRGQFITRLGWPDGNRKTLQIVTDGMKLAPVGPTILQERDAIVAAAQASAAAPEAAADVADVWNGFALRGMGFSASIQNPGTGSNNTAVTDGFDLPNLFQTPSITVSDSAGNNNGFPEPAEQLSITIPLTNNTGNQATGVTLQIVGGGSANYGTIANGTTVSQSATFTVPGNTPCGSPLNLTFNVNSNLGATSFTRTIIIGAPVTTFTQNFDGVTAPSLPAGWTATPVSGGTNFVTTTINSDSAPNSAYALDPTAVGGGTDLTSPAIPITAQAATVSFRHRFDTEPGWDGGLLEISIGGGGYQDVIAAGGAFVSNGYNGVLGVNTAGNSPLGGRNAWSGNSNGYITSVVRLPAAASGQNVQLRWRFGADDNTTGSGANPGWNIDGIQVAGSYTCGVVAPPIRSRADFDGDGKTDLSVYRPSEGNWYLNRSTAGFGVVHWGVSTDLTTPGDFDGDGKADFAVFRPSTGEWFVLRSGDNGYSIAPFGTSGDVPVTGDYDGDGKADMAVFRPSTNVWYIQNSGGGITMTPFGAAGDLPVRGDYNGDGKTDIAVFRPSTGTWWISNSGGSVTTTNFGLAADKPVTADYDGDNKDDIAVFRPSNGTWYIQRSSNGAVDFVTFGISTDLPVAGDYDGDGKDDVAVYRDGTWYAQRSSAGILITNFGLSSDTALPSRYIP
ncbi:MAG TPA: M36 family metallopeptidase [Pyrinomonadaceae bacterium]|nr:M36 family metallopeptidase [Pyrinomonadaceae bacterium]